MSAEPSSAQIYIIYYIQIHTFMYFCAFICVKIHLNSHKTECFSFDYSQKNKSKILKVAFCKIFSIDFCTRKHVER